MQTGNDWIEQLYVSFFSIKYFRHKKWYLSYSVKRNKDQKLKKVKVKMKVEEKIDCKEEKIKGWNWVADGLDEWNLERLRKKREWERNGEG